jgi:hypothetical protein
MEKITDILFSHVEDEDGRSYGRVFELRSEGDPEHGEVSKGRSIDTLLCGKIGFLQEFGFDARDITVFDWDSIIDIKKGKIIVRPPGKKSK